jgi:putative flippase GtrA
MRYLLVGGFAYLVHLCIFLSIRPITGEITSNSIGFAAAIFVNYFAQAHLVFKQNATLESFVSYVIICILGLLLHNILLASMLSLNWQLVYSHVLSSSMILGFNFLLGRFLIFARHKN